MFEHQWDRPHAVTRRADLDPRALSLATEWTLSLSPIAGTAGEGKSVSEPTDPASQTVAEILSSLHTTDPSERYRQLLTKMNELKKQNFAGSHTKPLLYLPKGEERSSIIDDSLRVLIEHADAVISTWQGLSQSKWSGGPVLAFRPDEKRLAIIADDPRTTALCVIPGPDHDISAWCFGLRPQLLGTTEDELWGANGLEVLDPVVVEALRSVTVVVNVSSELVPMIDRVHAITALRLLWDGGHDVVPKEVHAWALANGWRPKGAFALREIAERIAAGKSFKLAKEVGPSPFNSASLRAWREAARGRCRAGSKSG